MANPEIGKALSKLRSMTQLSQKAFAELCGLPASNVAIAESGKQGLSISSAKLIEAATGCLAGTILSGGPLLSINKAPYTSELFAKWRSLPVEEEILDKGIRDVQLRIKLLLRAATSNSPAAYRAAYLRTRDTLDELRDAFGITQSDLDTAARLDADIFPVKTMSFDEIDTALARSPAWASCRGEFADVEHHDVMQEQFPVWSDAVSAMNEKLTAVSVATECIRTLWRIRRPSGGWRLIAVDPFTSNGIVGEDQKPAQEIGKLHPNVPRNKKSSRSRKAAEPTKA